MYTVLCTKFIYTTPTSWYNLQSTFLRSPCFLDDDARTLIYRAKVVDFGDLLPIVSILSIFATVCFTQSVYSQSLQQVVQRRCYLVSTYSLDYSSMRIVGKH